MINTYFNFFDVLSLFGGFIALCLACVLIFVDKFRTKANIAIAIILFSVFLSILQNILWGNLEAINRERFRYYFPNFYILLMPLGFYYTIIFLLNPKYLFKQKDYFLIIPLLFTVATDAIFLFLYLFKTEVIEINSNAIKWYSNYFINAILLIYFFILLPISWKKLNTYQKQLLNNFSFIEDKSLDWIRKIILIIFVILFVLIALLISRIYFPTYELTFSYLLNLLISALICFITFRFTVNQKFYLVPDFQDKNDNISLSKPLSEKADEHYQLLLNLMTQEKLYQDAELNMDTLSAKVQLSKGYLSKIINQKEGKNFYDFVNYFRVEEVKNNLNNPDYAHYSILGIGLAAGFKSKSTFNTVFKKMTKMTPSVYKKTFK